MSTFWFPTFILFLHICLVHLNLEFAYAAAAFRLHEDFFLFPCVSCRAVKFYEISESYEFQILAHVDLFFIFLIRKYLKISWLVNNNYNVKRWIAKWLILPSGGSS